MDLTQQLQSIATSVPAAPAPAAEFDAETEARKAQVKPKELEPVDAQVLELLKSDAFDKFRERLAEHSDTVHRFLLTDIAPLVLSVDSATAQVKEALTRHLDPDADLGVELDDGVNAKLTEFVGRAVNLKLAKFALLLTGLPAEDLPYLAATRGTHGRPTDS